MQRNRDYNCDSYNPKEKKGAINNITKLLKKICNKINEIICLLKNPKFGLREIKCEVKCIEEIICALDLTTGPFFIDTIIFKNKTGSLIISIQNETNVEQVIDIDVVQYTFAGNRSCMTDHRCIPAGMTDNFEVPINLMGMMGNQLAVQYFNIQPGVYCYTALRTEAAGSGFVKVTPIASCTFSHEKLINLVTDQPC